MWRIALLLLLAAFKPEWRWEHPTPHGATIAALAGSGTTVHSAGARGTLLVSRDAGVTWATIRVADVVEDLHAIASTPGLVVAVGDRGRIACSRDGAAFDARKVGTAAFVAVAVRDATVIAARDDGTLVRSTDRCATFAGFGKVSGATSIAITANAVIVGTSSGLVRTDGTTTTILTREPVQRLAIDPAGTLYALAGVSVRYPSIDICGSCIDEHYETAALYRSTDGVTWERRTLADPSTKHRAWGAPKAPSVPAAPPHRFGHRGVGSPLVTPPWPQRALAIGADGETFASAGVLHVSADRGATFATAKVHGTALWAGRGVIVAAGERGAIARSVDRGARWTEIGTRRIADARNLFAIAATGNRAYAVGMEGYVVVRDRGSWRGVEVPTGKTQRLEAVHAVDATTVVVVGDNGVILQSTDGGKTFHHRASDRTTDLTAVWGLGDEVFAAGRETLLHSKDRGATWQSVTTRFYSARQIWGSSLDDLYLVGSGLFHSSDRGATWRELKPPLGATQGIWGSSAGDIFLVGYDGKIVHSSDRGATWKPRTSGTTRRLYGIWGHGDQRFVIGEEVVLHSTDRGVTWRDLATPIDVGLLAITGTADAVYLLGVSSSILRRPLR